MKKLKVLVSVALIMVLALLVYYYAINKTDGVKEEDKDSGQLKVEKAISMDLENNYPKTLKEVMSYFITIQECYYNEECTEEQLSKLAYNAMQLFDEQLVGVNPYDIYYEQLKKEIESFKAEQKVINNAIIDKASLEYSEIEEVEYASIKCIYYLKTPDITTKVEEVYAFRKDSEGNWKILGWDKYEPSIYE